jgi:hypothetical protein
MKVIGSGREERMTAQALLAKYTRYMKYVDVFNLDLNRITDSRAEMTL